MTSEQWQQIKVIVQTALEIEPAERSRFIAENCSGDKVLYREVQSLLYSHENAGDFIQTPAFVGRIKLPATNNFSAELETGKNIGHYEVLSELGRGGMGAVYLAEDTRLKRKAAIKILPSDFAAHTMRVRGFEQEALAVSSLNHPNILTIYEIGRVDSIPFIVTEFIDGVTLRERLAEASIDLSEALDVFVQVAAALAAAHSAGIVHRDIKPENIMIRTDGLVKVLDFGIAKLAEETNQTFIGLEDETANQSQTAKGVILGTVSYMSPEQAKGEKVDARTDIFSFGVLVYEMIAGRTPFAGESVSETFDNLINTEPKPLSQSASNVPDELQRIVSEMLRKNKDERYQTMNVLLADLKDLKENLSFAEKLERSVVPVAKGTETGIIAERPTAKHSGQLRRILSTRPSIIYAVVLLTLMLGAFGYWQRWQQTSVAPPLQTEIKSLAVLPLKSLDSGDNYLGLGIADAVIRRISQTGELTVRPTSAVRRYLIEETDALTAARQLNADAVLEGSVQRDGDRLRVSVNLLRMSDETSLWADSFDIRMSDIFTIQDTVAQQVAARLRLRLNPEQQARLTKRHTLNPEAYEYFLKGKASLDQRTIAIGNLQPIEAAIGYFKKAVALDPKYALAYASLAEAYSLNAGFNDPDNPVWIELMQEALAQAESLDPQLAEIHKLRADYFLSQHGGWNHSQAAREARQALDLNPSVGHSALGSIYDHLGLDETTGLREFQREIEIDPTDEFSHWRLADAYFLYGKFDEALEVSRRSSGVPFAPALIGKGQLDEAAQVLEVSLKKSPGNMRDQSSLALIMALKGRHEDAEAALPAILQQARNQTPYHHITYNAACIYALGGKTGESLKWLRTTAETGMPNYPLFERDPYLNRIRQAPEFIQFLAEMKEQHERYKREFE